MGAGALLSAFAGAQGLAQAVAGDDSTVFELRVYHTNEGKLDDLLALMRHQIEEPAPAGNQPG